MRVQVGEEWKRRREGVENESGRAKEESDEGTGARKGRVKSAGKGKEGSK